MAAIAFNNIDPNVAVPLFYAEVDNSAANLFSQEQKTLLIGQVAEGSEAALNVPVLVTRLDQARETFGNRSMLARMYEKYRKTDAFGEVCCLPLASGIDAPADEDSGEGTGDGEAETVVSTAFGAVASGLIAIDGSADESGTLFFRIAGTLVRCGVSKADALSTIAINLAAAINADPYLPVTAQPSNNTVTLTAVQAGEAGNEVKVYHNFSGAAGGENTPSGLSVTITQMVGGSGTPDLDDAMAAMGDEPYDFVVCPFSNTNTLSVLSEIMNDTSGRWSWLKQIYGHVYAARRGTLSDLVAFGGLLNDQHATVVGMENDNPVPAAEFAAAYAARNAVYLRIDPARPTQTGELIGVLATRPESRFLMEERQILLTNGIATATVTAGVTVMVERAVTTYQRNKYGDKDVSYLDSETMFTLMAILRRLKTLVTSKYGRHKLANDGTRFGAGQAIVTPAIIRGELIAEYARMERLGLVENADLFAENLIVARNADNANRVDVLFPPDLVNQLRIFALLNQFRLQYAEA